MFVAQHTDNPAPHRDRGPEEGRNAKGLEVAFRQSARGRVLQGAVCNDRLSGGQRLKIAGTVREAQPPSFALLIEAFRVAQTQDFTNNGGPIFLEWPVTDTRYLKRC